MPTAILQMAKLSDPQICSDFGKRRWRGCTCTGHSPACTRAFRRRVDVHRTFFGVHQGVQTQSGRAQNILWRAPGHSDAEWTCTEHSLACTKAFRCRARSTSPSTFPEIIEQSEGHQLCPLQYGGGQKPTRPEYDTLIVGGGHPLKLGLDAAELSWN